MGKNKSQKKTKAQQEISNVYTTLSGDVLKLKPCKNKLALQEILFRTGIKLDSDNPEQVFSGFDDKVRSGKAMNQWLNYCLVEGIDSVDIPQEDIDMLWVMNFDVSNKRLLPMLWLRYIILQDETEAGELAGIITALSFTSDDELEETKQEN